MNKPILLTIMAWIALSPLGLCFPATESKLDIAKIEALTGLKGKLNEQEGVFKVSVPRNDMKITVDGWPMPPFMGLTSWAAFVPGMNSGAMVMGDLVLMQDEVNPVMSALLDSGLAVTALHNHFFYDEPKIYFMHIAGEGPTDKLATGVKAAFDKVEEIRSANPQVAKSFGKPFAPERNAITGSKIAEILGIPGESKDGMYKVIVGRKTTMADGGEVGKEMGVNTWAAFAGTDDNAVVDGDFAVLETELQPVLKSLRASGINIVAIHSHMALETPRILFFHYWGKGTAVDLAKGVKAALDQISKNSDSD